MSDHRLVARQHIPRPLDEVFEFFSRPANLGRITPPSMGFELVSDDLEMRAGLRIDYRIRPLLGIPLTWRSVIESYDPPHGFSDVQLMGPYRRWVHHHRFEAVDGGTLMIDEVDYRLPLGPIGEVLGRGLVRGELERIFGYRAAVVATALRQPEATPTGRTVAVAGGTGFVGGGIADTLHRRGERVVVLSHRGPAARGPLPDGVEIRTADVTDPATLEPALAGVDALVIALAFPNSPMEAPRRGYTFEAVDAEGTVRLVAAARSAGVRRLVYISGAGAAPDAERHWFRAKWRAEEAVRSSGIAWTIVRPTWIYGPRDVALNRFVDFARRLPFVPLTNGGGQALAPVFLDDVAGLVADALQADDAVQAVFEIGGPETMTMRDVIRRTLAVVGLRRPILPAPPPLLKLAAWPLSWLPSPPLTPSAIDFINQPATVDSAPLLARMPRRLTPLEEGLATYLGPDPTGRRMLTVDRAAGVASPAIELS
jgi:NADH dehydrogenase